MKIKILIKVLFMKFFEKYPNLINDRNHVRILYFTMFGKIPNLDNPKTFNEYICSMKIRDEIYDYWRYTDKYEVRKYVKEKIGSKYLNEVLGIYNSFDEIDFPALPDSFVLKATHGSSYNIIVTEKSALDNNKAKKKFDKWLNENFYYKDREKNYFKIKPRIMCDKFLESRQGDLEEFKLFCFYGKVKVIQYNREIGGKRYSNIYDENWNLINVKYGYSNFVCDKLPENKDELVEISQKLSDPFQFVRVDLYNVDKTIIFSELTFHSGGGLVPFYPKTYDYTFSKYFTKEGK